jgi:hypothetical protein
MHDAEVHGDDPMLEKWGRCRPVPSGAGRCRPVPGRTAEGAPGGRPVPVAGQCRWPAGAGCRPVPVAGRCRPVPAGAGLPGLYTT